MLEYDNSAFYYFAITLLSLYIIPGGWYALTEVYRAFIASGEAGTKARTDLEKEKASKATIPAQKDAHQTCGTRPARRKVAAARGARRQWQRRPRRGKGSRQKRPRNSGNSFQSCAFSHPRRRRSVAVIFV